MRTPAFSVAVITVPVSDVERWLRFYVDPAGFTLDADSRPRTARSGSCSSFTDAPGGSFRNIFFVATYLRPRGGA